MPTSTFSAADTDHGGTGAGHDAKRFLVQAARAAGFDEARVLAAADVPVEFGARLDAAIAAGNHGDMTWLADTADRRRHPRALWSDVRSVVMVAMNYGPEHDPLPELAHRERGVVSVYARGRDYHDVMKGRMKTLGQQLAARFGGDLKVFVDTAPVMEKPLAQLAGVGWQGKHTNLVSRTYGSWLFLGAIFTTLSLPPDSSEEDHCGSCRACLDVCPTDAFPAPYRLDARRCLAYLTIEAKHMIPLEFRAPMGNRIFGCDDCLAVCPWNKFASAAQEVKFADSGDPAPLSVLGALDDAAFRKRYAGTPVKRLGRERFVRNATIALGNAADKADHSVIERNIADEAGQVRAAAAWAARRVMPAERYAALRSVALGRERDEAVRSEWGA